MLHVTYRFGQNGLEHIYVRKVAARIVVILWRIGHIIGHIDETSTRNERESGLTMQSNDVTMVNP